MKRILFLVLTVVLLCGCATGKQEHSQGEQTKGKATEEDIARLEALYDGREAYHGEFHNHADTGGTSDGHKTLDAWKENMAAQNIDFATIVDHKQMLHMELPEWDDTLFIGGSEAGTKIADAYCDRTSMHYNMIFATAEDFDGFLRDNDKQFNLRYGMGGEGHFFKEYYQGYTWEQLRELAAEVMEHGGFFTHVHPKGDEYLSSDDPMDYWFGDYTGLEVLLGDYGNMSDRRNQAAYELWVKLLNLGKRVWATSGSDSHSFSQTMSLTTVYSQKKNASTYLDHFRKGDFTAGPVGIRMCIGDAVTGGTADFTDQRLVVSVGDFHPNERYPYTYRLEIYNDKGLVYSQDFSGKETLYVALDTEECMYYRADVYCVTGDYRFAVGNPIWNEGTAQ